ncbi:iron-sulfur cluster biosynthesis family protein, partial [Pseudomonas sp.]|uniref:iron-sulfur cluster biosynthesis family protein n=1 Tax=Pseudomonas sp. TaxID=306 RepID=UPI00299DCC24
MSTIIITDAAHDYLADLLSKQNTTGIGIRVFITQPGSQYAETCIAYCKPGEEKPDDTAIALASFTAWIDAVSEPFLEDAVVDYATDRMGGQLTIPAPNAMVPMFNEDSPLNERISYYLKTEITPGLASHGGEVSLIDVV